MDGFNDLATTHPDIAAEADGSDPRTVPRSNGTQRNWECSQGHRWWVTVDKRTHGHGCPFCSGHRVSVGFNDLATTHPEVAWQAVDFDPETVSAGSALRATWKCREGHTWTALVSTRTGQHGSGCPTCATYGYDPTRPGWLYLMERPGEQQIGITNVPEQRLRFHETRRWELLDIVGPASGVRIQRVERELKAWLRPNFGRIPGTHENWYVVEGTYVGTLDELLCRAALPSWGTSGLVVS